MSQKVELQVLNDLVIVGAKIRIFSGKRALDDNETPDNGGDVVDWGSKWVIDRKLLKPFNKIKMAVERLKRTYATKFLDECVAPPERATVLIQKIKTYEPEWKTETAAFLKAYPQAVYDWAQRPANSEWRQSIIDSAPDVGDVEKRLSFRVGGYKIGVIDEHSDLLADEVAGLAGQVAMEVATYVRNSFEGGDGQTTQRVRNLIVKVKTKLMDFAFLDDALTKAVARIDETMSRLPPTGVIAGVDFMLLQSLMAFLSNPKQILYGEELQVIADDPTEELLVMPQPELFVPTQSVAVQQELDWAF